MVCDIELPFNYHTKMNRCQLKFLLYLLTKQNGDIKPKWWPNNMHFEQPISNSLAVSKNSLIDVINNYYKYKGDSDWLRAVLFFIMNLDNLTNEIDFGTIDISGKISHNGTEFDIVPLLKHMNPVVKLQPVNYIMNKKNNFTIMNQNTVRKSNVPPAVVAQINGTGLKDKASGTDIDNVVDLTDIEDIDKELKLCIKESHIKQMMPTASIQLYDVIKYNTMHSKEDFLLTLNLMKTDVLSKLNLLKYRKRLRNTSRDSFRSVSEFEKDLIKFRTKPNKEQSKQKESNKKLQTKVKEKDKTESTTTNTECMVVDNPPLPLPLPLNEIIDVDGSDIDMNKENENTSKENITSAANSICSPKTVIPLQVKNYESRPSTDSEVIDLTLEETPTKIQKRTNSLYQFLNMSPLISPKKENKMTPTTSPKKQSSPKNLKRLNRFSMPLMNQKDIKSYFNPIPMKLTPEFIAKKLDELKKVCRPCFVRLDLVKDLKPIRSITKIAQIETLPLPMVIEEVTASIIDLTNDEDLIEPSVNEPEKVNVDKKVSEPDTNKAETIDKVKNKPKNDSKIKNDVIKKKKVIIKVKWPSKRITL